MNRREKARRLYEAGLLLLEARDDVEAVAADDPDIVLGPVLTELNDAIREVRLQARTLDPEGNGGETIR